MEVSREDYELTGNNTGQKYSWTPLVRQIFVCSGVTSYFFIHGLYLGSPTVYVPQIRREANSTEAISTAVVSWLSSIASFSSVPWTIFFCILAQYFGRKIPYTILWLTTVVGGTIFYYSTSVTQIFVSGIFNGALSAALVTVMIMVLTEYTSPRYRGIFMTFKSATIYWGIWVANFIGTFYHWKNIGILILICCFFNISTLFWPQSPYWLASKGRFKECEKYHKWLKGEDQDSLEELKYIITTQKSKIKEKKKRGSHHTNNKYVKCYQMLKSKTFYRPITYSLYTACLYHLSGKLACTVYAIDIIKKITVSESTAYQGMLILDGVTVFGMYVGCGLTKFLKRRTILLLSSSVGVVFLFILSFYLYMIYFNIISENKYISLALLTVFSVSMSCGPMIMSNCLSGELTPLKYRNSFLCLHSLLTNIIMAIVLKASPYIFQNFGSHGAFLFYGVSSSVFIYLLYKYLPETKDKTIIEIEICVSGNDNLSSDEDEPIIDATRLRLHDTSSIK